LFTKPIHHPFVLRRKPLVLSAKETKPQIGDKVVWLNRYWWRHHSPRRLFWCHGLQPTLPCLIRRSPQG